MCNNNAIYVTRSLKQEKHVTIKNLVIVRPEEKKTFATSLVDGLGSWALRMDCEGVFLLFCLRAFLFPFLIIFFFFGREKESDAMTASKNVAEIVLPKVCSVSHVNGHSDKKYFSTSTYRFGLKVKHRKTKRWKINHRKIKHRIIFALSFYKL